MYQVAIRKPLTSFHHLIGGDWGSENEHHAHDYTVEVVLEGPRLNHHGYLFDIAELKTKNDAVWARYSNADLNALPEFEGLNPSVEHFARLYAERLRDSLALPGVSELKLTLWEDETAWASYRIVLK